MYLIRYHTSWQIAGWFGPYTILEVMPSAGAAVCLDLPESVGKMSDVANVRRLKFYEERDTEFGAQDPPVTHLTKLIPWAWNVMRLTGF